jgi:ADP-ribosylation factor-binding protein GGA
LIEKSLSDPKTPLTAAVNSSSSNQAANISNLSLNDLQQIKNTSTSTVVKNIEENASFSSLNSLFVELESIKPGHLAPYTLYDKNNLKVVLHFGKDSPIPDVNVIVISATSSNTQTALKNFTFQAAVPKVLYLNDKICF